MRKLDRFLRWTNVFFYLLAFIVLVSYGVLSHMDVGGGVVRELRHNPLYWIVTAFFGILFVLQWFSMERGIQTARSRDYLRVANEDGEILVSLRAIEDSLSRTARTLPDIHDVEVRIEVPELAKGEKEVLRPMAPAPVPVPAEEVEGSRATAQPSLPDAPAQPPARLVDQHGLVVRAHFRTWEGKEVNELHEKLQQLLKSRFQEIVAVEELPPFVVVLTDIIPREEAQPEGRKRKKAEEDEPMFTGPRYM